MELKIYKVKGSAFKEENSFKSFPLGKGDSSYSLGGMFRGFEDLYLGGNLYLIEKREDLDRFFNPLGSFFPNKKYYLSHPKKERNYLLESRVFHEYILKEQIFEIATFLHIRFNLREFKVKILEGENFFKEEGLGKEVFPFFKEEPVSLFYEEGALRIRWEEDFNKPSLDWEKDFLWPFEFENLMDFVKLKGDDIDLKGESLSFKRDNSFGLSKKIGGRIGVKEEVLKEYIFIISF